MVYMKELIIIKTGGSIITDKKSERPKVNYENLEKIAKEIADCYKKGDFGLVLVHGAGSYGHPIVKQTGIHKGIRNEDNLVDFAETQRLQNELNSEVVKIFIKHGLPAMPHQASSHAIMYDKKLIVMNVNAIKGLLEIGIVPVLYGVPAYDEKQKCSILSGDQIAPYLAKELDAKKIIHVTDVNGIFTSDPNMDSSAEHIPEITRANLDYVKEKLSGSRNVDVTGGMFNKVSALLEAGVPSYIIGYGEKNITKTLNGERVGTVIKV